MENKYAKEFLWKFFPVIREKKRGTKGGILIGVRKSWIDEKEIKIIKVEESLIKTRLKIKEGTFIMYVQYTMRDKLKNSGKFEKKWIIWKRKI